MRTLAFADARPNLWLSAAHVASASAIGAALLLLSLHLLSPEFNPSWRMISEYANGRYACVLALMFATWGLSSWALAGGLWSRVEGWMGRIGLCLLAISGVGEAMASVFDVNQHPMH